MTHLLMLVVSFAGSTCVVTAPTNVSETLATHILHATHVTADSATPDIEITHVNGLWTLRKQDAPVCTTNNDAGILDAAMQFIVMDLIEKTTADIVFHAGVVTNGDKTVLILGPSGSGKTTLTLSLLTQGFHYISDEVAVVTPDTLDCIGFGRSLILKEQSTFPWQNLIRPDTAQNILALPQISSWAPSECFSPKPSQLGSLTVNTVLFPTYEAGASTNIQLLSSGEAAYSLLKNCVNARSLPNNGIPAIGRLATRVDAYTLHYSNVDNIVTWLNSI